MRFYLTGEAAKMAGVCSKSVRTYCREGLVNPIRDSSGRRLFTDEDIKAIRSAFQKNQTRMGNLLGD